MATCTLLRTSILASLADMLPSLTLSPTSATSMGSPTTIFRLAPGFGTTPPFGITSSMPQWKKGTINGDIPDVDVAANCGWASTAALTKSWPTPGLRDRSPSDVFDLVPSGKMWTHWPCRSKSEATCIPGWCKPPPRTTGRTLRDLKKSVESLLVKHLSVAHMVHLMLLSGSLDPSPGTSWLTTKGSSMDATWLLTVMSPRPSSLLRMALCRASTWPVISKDWDAWVAKSRQRSRMLTSRNFRKAALGASVISRNDSSPAGTTSCDASGRESDPPAPRARFVSRPCRVNVARIFRKMNAGKEFPLPPRSNS
mmetsp:Transcript_5011/g.13116  ORF Transcript_5011/g.13116 Transcript_5011/m.13116 type:complete len:311 (+) Transcript_5011:978-1910(+)